MGDKAKFKLVLTLLKSLSKEYLQRILLMLMDEDIVKSSSIIGYIEKERYVDGWFCPRCNSKHIVRNGHRKSDNVQRLLCKDCNRSFIASTNTVVSGTRKDLKVWEKYIECMMNSLSIRKTAEICGIHRNTAFVWRHKILDVLWGLYENEILDGIIEADETFFPVSYKGNHSKSKSFTMPRKAHHRGHSVRKKGLSDEQVCVVCAVNRKGQSVSVVGKLGKVSQNCLTKALGSHIKEGSVLCTDYEQSYYKLAKDCNCKLVKIASGMSKKGIYNIQHINNYHSLLKTFMVKFKGVSTKYLNNYLVWNNYVNYEKGEYREKLQSFIERVMTGYSDRKCRGMSARFALPLLC